MFTKIEGILLTQLINDAIDLSRDELQQPKNVNDKEKLETQLIQLVSCFNKIKHDLQKLQPSSDGNASKYKILIVDDVESMRVVTTSMLRKLGFEYIKEANSAESALIKLKKAVAENDKFDIVITDWEMDGKSGLDLLREIRLDANMLETAVYILTGHGEQSHILKAINAGVTGYILKPLNFQIFSQKLSAYLPKKNTEMT